MSKPDISLHEYQRLRQEAIETAQRQIVSGRSYKRKERLVCVVTPLTAKRFWLLASLRGCTLSSLLDEVLTEDLERLEKRALDGC